jgi:hypothetical protein
MIRRRLPRCAKRSEAGKGVAAVEGVQGAAGSYECDTVCAFLASRGKCGLGLLRSTVLHSVETDGVRIKSIRLNV